jgi:uncharacterized protein
MSDAPNQQPPTSDYGSTPLGNKDERMWATFCHLAALAGYVFPFGGNVIGPLVVWLIKKEDYPLVNDQGKESLNFQITVLIAAVICFALVFVAVGIVLLPLLAVCNLIFIIIGSMKANAGEAYRYPVAIRFIK